MRELIDRFASFRARLRRIRDPESSRHKNTHSIPDNGFAVSGMTLELAKFVQGSTGVT